MWGSYVGAFSLWSLVGIIIVFFMFYDINVLRNFHLPIFQGICSGYGFLSGLGCVLFFGLLIHFIIFSLGFIIGWGVHSLIRRLGT